MLAWRFDRALTVASTAACGGGLGPRRWVINAQVVRHYARHDLERHGAELAVLAGMRGPGVVMLTAADVRRVQRADMDGVAVEVTVGLTHPTWAAGDDESALTGCVATPGTVNIVAVLPARLAPAGLLNALCTATEAKSQALLAAGVEGTGTASDAVTIACPVDGPADPFGGPRSRQGSRLARAVHDAVLAGAADDRPAEPPDRVR